MDRLPGGANMDFRKRVSSINDYFFQLASVLPDKVNKTYGITYKPFK